ncbi:hypothetical protein QOZ80_8BG0650490 [Eleusine coracana subsp. coracana]|nr:hypothetical protein QOZ80_8BG0650490 [Eleusine coracana subsp. coracana]
MGSESKKTASRHTTEADTGTHAFEIVGYTLKKGIGVSKFIRSGTFTVGGIDCLSFQIERSELEAKSAGYIVNNGLTIECRVTVIKESQVSDITGDLEIEVPPSDLSDHFGKLLLEEERADVTFSVGGENFPAHRTVLATRSPVLKAELYGHMKERRARRVTGEDMQPEVFKALLQFIYTDSLPDWDDLDVDGYCEILRHLLVAADRYALDRLKLLCASLLVKYLDADTVATTLALADQHNCEKLKDVCIEFMTSSGEMEAVVATHGYANLKRTCPSILVDVLEKISRYVIVTADFDE